MEQGILDNLRDGTLGDGDLVLSFRKMKPFKRQLQLPIRSIQPINQKRHSKSKRTNDHGAVRSGKAEDMDEDSDGGFFEEAGGVKI